MNTGKQAGGNSPSNSLVQFLRRRDYTFIKELGQGACGKTVLLHDPQIDERFVCKKYVPYAEEQRQELFANFVREVKLLHKLHHENVVRVFNCYLYPDQLTGYILMEHVDGEDIDDFISSAPEQTNETFVQAISGFSYLEKRGVLHRDIRPGNVMVREDGIVKIIDLGFGKEIRTASDFKKSISLNLWCQPPKEFDKSLYDFGTEVYFVGKLFEKIIQDNGIKHFAYGALLDRMCALDPGARIPSFVQVEREITSKPFDGILFTDEELELYRDFADNLCNLLARMDSGAKYIDDLPRIQKNLADAYRNCMLEQFLPDPKIALNCFINGAYTYYPNRRFPVACFKSFLKLMKSPSEEKNRIILANLHSRLDAIPRSTKADDTAEDIPF